MKNVLSKEMNEKYIEMLLKDKEKLPLYISVFVKNVFDDTLFNGNTLIVLGDNYKKAFALGLAYYLKDKGVNVDILPLSDSSLNTEDINSLINKNIDILTYDNSLSFDKYKYIVDAISDGILSFPILRLKIDKIDNIFFIKN